MVFWSFLAGLVTFYCSIGPETLLPNIFFSIRPRNKVSHTCAAIGWGAALILTAAR